MEEEVTVRCKRTVVSTRPVQVGEFYHTSVLGRAMEKSRLRVVFYYRFPPDTDIGGVTARLRETLSELLSSYPVLTGRLQRAADDHWMVKFNDVGVRMVEATAGGGVEEWLRKVDRRREMKLVYWEDMYHHKPYFWSTSYVQLTEFEKGGLAIGLSCTHLLADAASITAFINAWADMTLLGKMLHPPCFDPLPARSLADDRELHCSSLIDCYVKSAEEVMKYPSPCKNHEEFATVAFEFAEEMVLRCIAEAGGGSGGGRSPSPFEALAALFWVCVSRANGRANGGLIDMSICLDMRKPLGLHAGFFGNGMVFGEVRGEGIAECELDRAAKAVSDAVEKMGNEGTVMGLLQWLQEANGVHHSAAFRDSALVCFNWEDLSPYSAVFEPGGGGPIRVSYYLESMDRGAGHVVVLPSPHGRDGSLSRVVMVTLPEDQACMVSEDALLHRFSPSVLMREEMKCNA